MKTIRIERLNPAFCALLLSPLVAAADDPPVLAAPSDVRPPRPGGMHPHNLFNPSTFQPFNPSTLADTAAAVSADSSASPLLRQAAEAVLKRVGSKTTND